ncbi:hypothetical protein [Chryseobacterium indologenes]|uniref:Uncharacterized protein n=1 Tax=Chryseobacterium indologenes TaxID=253 RepID=A0A0N0ZV54_CHRID|nr:hypothetical protein [Chryseobacterium indologenes]KPE49717.1 hypothetical protein AOB46_18455 [Chryseobacterium indologenes]
MKILTFKIAFFVILINVISCKAQQVYPLNTFMENIPEGGYVKDLNNELEPYIGVYKAVDQGNEITLFITKEENRLTKRVNKKFYRDALIVKFIIKNSSGQILQDTQNGITSLNNIHSLGTNPNLGAVILYYEGTNCGIGWGKIILKKLNMTQFSWTYSFNGSVITNENCSGNPDKTIYLPDTDGLIFTKQ